MYYVYIYIYVYIFGDMLTIDPALPTSQLPGWVHRKFDPGISGRFQLDFPKDPPIFWSKFGVSHGFPIIGWWILKIDLKNPAGPELVPSWSSCRLPPGHWWRLASPAASTSTAARPQRDFTMKNAKNLGFYQKSIKSGLKIWMLYDSNTSNSIK